MFEHMMVLLNQFNEYAKVNPILAGAISLGGVGWLTYIARNLPLAIYRSIRNQLVTTLTVDNTESGMSGYAFSKMLTWVDSSRFGHLNREMYAHTEYVESTVKPGQRRPVLRTSLGALPMLTVWEGSLCIVSRKKLEAASKGWNNTINWELRITRFGRDKKSLIRLLASFDSEETIENPQIWEYGYTDGWAHPRDIQARSLSSVIVPAEVKTKIISAIDRFLASEQWYRDRGFPYQLCIMLKGIPGCGKTSLIRALSTHLQRDLYPIALPKMSDESLYRALSDAPKGSIVVMEDFNCAVLRARNSELSTAKRDSRYMKPQASEGPVSDSSAEQSSHKTKHGLSEDWLGLSLQGYLQAMDGLTTGGGKIIFMTTNVFDELDAAVVRPGRVDMIVELGALTDTEIKQYVQTMFDNVCSEVLQSVEFESITGAELQQIYKEHFETAEDFINHIPKKESIRLTA